MRTAKFAAIAVGLVVVLGAGYYLGGGELDGRIVKGPTQSESVVPSAMNVLTPREPLPQGPTVAHESPPIPGETLSARVDRLIATGKPSDAYAAYRVSAQCQTIRTYRESILRQDDPEAFKQLQLARLPSVEASCGDLSPGQIASRTEWLRKAAADGVHGAFTSLVAIAQKAIADGKTLVATARGQK